MRCLSGRNLCAKRAIFSAIWPRIGPIIRHSKSLSPFCPSPCSRCRSHLMNPRNTKWQSIFLQSSISSEQIRQRTPLFRLFLGLSWVPVGPCFVGGRETTQKLIRIILKQQALLWSGFMVRLLSEVSKRSTHRAGTFLVHNTSCSVWLDDYYLAHLQLAVWQYEIVSLYPSW